jgi:hypothetical protein
MRRSLIGLAVAAGTLAAAGAAGAHHSFAVFFDGDKTTTKTGVVKTFQFTNPHGIIEMVVTDGGKAQTWRVETNAPVLLRRRGWTPTIIKAGDRVTIDGWPARDGSNYMRLRAARDGAGKPIGSPIASVQAEQK